MCEKSMSVCEVVCMCVLSCVILCVCNLRKDFVVGFVFDLNGLAYFFCGDSFLQFCEDF